MEKASNKLSITPKEQIPLTRNQKEFNRLTAKIEKLRKEIIKESEFYETMFAAAAEHLVPADEAEARARMALATTLDGILTTGKFTAAFRRDIRSCIQDLCAQAFEVMLPTQEEKDIYDRNSSFTYDEEIQFQQDQQKEIFETMMKAVYDMDVDMDQLKDPEQFEQFREVFEEKAQRGPSAGQRKESKTQEKARLAREAKEKAAADLKAKSVRSIYISLAKLVHPDTETDELQRAVKEEEMKKLSAAYEAKDLPTLLRMEMEWMNKQSDHLGSIADDKLKLYVKVLQDQVDELETEKYMIGADPRFEPVREFAWGSKEDSLKRILNQAKKILKTAQSFDKEREKLSQTDSDTPLKLFVKAYLRRFKSPWF
ncbi:MAG: hypothetical protein IPN95_05880 [Bacteroidetes bacterium]|nr:hypothetical protein [Bacteroidota bacterium]